MANSTNSKFNSSNLKIAGLILAISTLLVILSVAAIIYARGSKPTKQGLVDTGNVRINSDIDNLTISVDGKAQAGKNKLITNLEPGDYLIEVTSPGFNTWSKTVTVQKGLVKDLFVRLIPTNVRPEKYSSFAVDRLVFAANSEYIYYVVKEAERGDNVGIWRERVRDGGRLNFFSSETTNKISNISRNIAEEIAAGHYNLIPSPDNKRLVLQVGQTNKKHFILQADNYNEPDNDNQLEPKLGYSPDAVEWLVESTTLLIKSDNLLVAYNLANTQAQVIDFHPDQSPLIYANSNQRVYLYKQSQGLGEITAFEDGKQLQIVLENIDLAPEVTKIYAAQSSQDFIYYQTAAKTIHFLDLDASYQKRLPENVNEIVSVSPSGLGAIVKLTDGRYGLYVVEEIRATGSYEPRLEVLSQTNIAQIRYTSKGNNLLLTTSDNDLYIADRDGANPIKLVAATDALKLSSASSFNINSSATKLLFLATAQETEAHIYQVLLKNTDQAGTDQPLEILSLF